MLPAHQRLYPANLGGGGIYQRLVMHHKLIALDRLQQFPANGHMLANGTILLAGVPLPGIAPLVLGLSHSGMGVGHQHAIALTAIGARRNPDAGTDMHRVLARSEERRVGKEVRSRW